MRRHAPTRTHMHSTGSEHAAALHFCVFRCHWLRSDNARIVELRPRAHVHACRSKKLGWGSISSNYYILQGSYPFRACWARVSSLCILHLSEVATTFSMHCLRRCAEAYSLAVWEWLGSYHTHRSYKTSLKHSAHMLAWG